MTASDSSIIRVNRFSLLTFQTVRPGRFRSDALRTVKESAVFDQPFVKKSASIATENFPIEFYEELKTTCAILIT
jgi:hypothetical protein